MIHILVVDDDKNTRKLLKAVLKSLSFICVVLCALVFPKCDSLFQPSFRFSTFSQSNAMCCSGKCLIHIFNSFQIQFLCQHLRIFNWYSIILLELPDKRRGGMRRLSVFLWNIFRSASDHRSGSCPTGFFWSLYVFFLPSLLLDTQEIALLALEVRNVCIPVPGFP